MLELRWFQLQSFYFCCADGVLSQVTVNLFLARSGRYESKTRPHISNTGNAPPPPPVRTTASTTLRTTVQTSVRKSVYGRLHGRPYGRPYSRTYERTYGRPYDHLSGRLGEFREQNPPTYPFHNRRDERHYVDSHQLF